MKTLSLLIVLLGLSASPLCANDKITSLVQELKKALQEEQARTREGNLQFDREYREQVDRLRFQREQLRRNSENLTPEALRTEYNRMDDEERKLQYKLSETERVMQQRQLKGGRT